MFLDNSSTDKTQYIAWYPAHELKDSWKLFEKIKYGIRTKHLEYCAVGMRKYFHDDKRSTTEIENWFSFKSTNFYEDVMKCLFHKREELS